MANPTRLSLPRSQRQIVSKKLGRWTNWRSSKPPLIANLSKKVSKQIPPGQTNPIYSHSDFIFKKIFIHSKRFEFDLFLECTLSLFCDDDAVNGFYDYIEIFLWPFWILFVPSQTIRRRRKVYRRRLYAEWPLTVSWAREFRKEGKDNYFCYLELLGIAGQRRRLPR